MARTTKGKTRFPFRIVIVPPDKPSPKSPWLGTQRWKHRALYIIRMRLCIQLKKAAARARQNWFKFYWVYGYGAPGKHEFICWNSGMIGKAVKPEESYMFNCYWAACAQKTEEILSWLDSVPIQSYSVELNSYLSRLIVVSYGAREVEEYTTANPYEKNCQ